MVKRQSGDQKQGFPSVESARAMKVGGSRATMLRRTHALRLRNEKKKERAGRKVGVVTSPVAMLEK